MSAFQPGEIVDITIKGAVVNATREGPLGGLSYDVDGDRRSVPFTPSVTIERRAPAEWPPQPGDLWRAQTTGQLWFAADVRDVCETDEPKIVMVPTFEDFRKSPEEFRKSHYGRVALVHRDGPADPCGCDHHGDHTGCTTECECAS